MARILGVVKGVDKHLLGVGVARVRSGRSSELLQHLPRVGACSAWGSRVSGRVAAQSCFNISRGLEPRSAHAGVLHARARGATSDKACIESVCGNSGYA